MDTNEFNYLLRESLAMCEGLRAERFTEDENRSDAVDLIVDALLAFAPANAPQGCVIISDAA